MLSVADALAAVLNQSAPRPAHSTVLQPADIGRVLAEDVRAEVDAPPFDKSVRDGYAVWAADVPPAGASLLVTAEIPAGAARAPLLNPGEAARIFTGGPLPSRADAVVMQEDCTRSGDRVHIAGPLKPGQFIVRRGAEYRAGEVVLPAGTVLGPQEIGVLAGLGCVHPALHPVPRVAVLSTGSELVEPNVQPAGSQIRNSNGPMLLAQVLRADADGHALGIVDDNKQTLTNRVRLGLDTADVTVVSGGVSVGDYDHLPHILKDLGVVTHFHQVAMKPGKPVLFGSWKGRLLFGLPGHPVSSFVCFELFVRPALDRLRGLAVTGLPWADLPLTAELTVSNDRPTFYPATLTAGPTLRVSPNGGANSANLHSLTGADALISVPAGPVRLAAGDLVSTLRLVR